jgi:pyrroline-5-carboxylate reductase
MFTSSCKPQTAQVILNEQGIREALDGKLVISIVAGVTISQMKEWITPETRLVRAMPNTPCKVCLRFDRGLQSFSRAIRFEKV